MQTKVDSNFAFRVNAKLEMMFMKHYAPNPLLVKEGLISFQCPNLQRAITYKYKITFFKFSPRNLLIILYQLTMFEAPSYNNFRDILMTSFNGQICKGQ